MEEHRIVCQRPPLPCSLSSFVFLCFAPFLWSQALPHPSPCHIPSSFRQAKLFPERTVIHSAIPYTLVKASSVSLVPLTLRWRHCDGRPLNRLPADSYEKADGDTGIHQRGTLSEVRYACSMVLKFQKQTVWQKTQLPLSTSAPDILVWP